MINIAILASGNGTNAESIIKYFKTHPVIDVKLIITDNPNAYVIERALNHGVECVIMSKNSIKCGTDLIEKLNNKKIEWIILAGFLLLIPKNVISLFNNKIINIHPALLPKYGGKGMYGMNVHKKVIENGEKLSGITIHFVNENYDEGDIIFKKSCTITQDDSPDKLAQKIHKLEHDYYPKIIEQTVLQVTRLKNL